MIAVEYRCECGDTGQMLEFKANNPEPGYPQEQFCVKCSACGTQTFRFDSPQAAEMDWAAMDGHAVEYTRERDCCVA